MNEIAIKCSFYVLSDKTKESIKSRDYITISINLKSFEILKSYEHILARKL